MDEDWKQGKQRIDLEIEEDVLKWIKILAESRSKSPEQVVSIAIEDFVKREIEAMGMTMDEFLKKYRPADD